MKFCSDQWIESQWVGTGTFSEVSDINCKSSLVSWTSAPTSLVGQYKYYGCPKLAQPKMALSLLNTQLKVSFPGKIKHSGFLVETAA